MVQILTNLSDSVVYSSSSPSTTTSLPASFWVAYFIFLFAVYIYGGFVLSKIFKKAGRKGWPAFVPGYSSWVLLELGGQSGANVFWVFLPFVGSIVYLVFLIKAMLEMGRRFGKNTVFSVFGLILFQIVGYSILAFDKSVYEGGDSMPPIQPPTSGSGVVMGSNVNIAPVAPVALQQPVYVPPSAPEAPTVPAVPGPSMPVPETPQNQGPIQPPTNPIV